MIKSEQDVKLDNPLAKLSVWKLTTRRHFLVDNDKEVLLEPPLLGESLIGQKFTVANGPLLSIECEWVGRKYSFLIQAPGYDDIGLYLYAQNYATKRMGLGIQFG